MTFLSLIFLGIDLVLLLFEMQTPQSKALMHRLGGVQVPESHEEEEKMEELPNNGHSDADDHAVAVKIYQMTFFILWIGACIALSFVFEEYEPCLMNWATLAPAAIDIWIWLNHRKVSRKLHIVVIMTVLLWSFAVLTYKMICQ